MPEDAHKFASIEEKSSQVNTSRNTDKYSDYQKSQMKPKNNHPNNEPSEINPHRKHCENDKFVPPNYHPASKKRQSREKSVTRSYININESFNKSNTREKKRGASNSPKTLKKKGKKK